MVGVARNRGISRRGILKILVKIEAVSRSAFLLSVSRASEAAVCGCSGDAAGIYAVTAIALVAVFDSEILELGA